MTPTNLILFALLFAAAAHFISIAVLVARSYLKPPAKSAIRPPVTILRPACGIENHIEATLESAFFIDYPEFEIVFCVQRDDDPIIPVIEAIRARHPNVPSRLLIGDDRISINPKLNNLVKGWREAKHEWIIMTDSNVLLTPDYIDTLLARWTPGVGLVCSPPVGTEPEGVGAELECAFLNTYQARWQLTADAFGFAFAQGKTIFWRRADLDRAGGIAALAAEPAEGRSRDQGRAQGREPCPPRPQSVAAAAWLSPGWRHLEAPAPLGAPAPRYVRAALRAGTGVRRLPAAGHGRCPDRHRPADLAGPRHAIHHLVRGRTGARLAHGLARSRRASR